VNRTPIPREQRATALRTGAVACVLALAAALLARWPAGEWLAAAAGVAVGLLYWRAQAAAARERSRLVDAIDAMEAGVVLYDPDDRLVLANADFRRLYETPGVEIQTGKTFEALLHESVRAGRVPEAKGREEAWIAERVALHRQAEPNSFLREMADGRWRRITEQRLPDGSRLAFSIDVTELVAQQHAAERAHALLDNAIEAMPAAVEIYDRDDRLVLFNRRLLTLYPHIAGKPLLGQTFEILLRRAVAGGHVPGAVGREEAWLAERLAERGKRREPRLQRAPDGSWTHIYETPMPEGGLVAVRLDATEIVRQREELEDAVEALPEGFALFDAEDRLLLCNQTYRDLYRHSAAAIRPGASFESILRYGLERDQYPQAGASAAEREAWLAERLRRHREPDGKPILQELPDNRWLRIDERRTRAGGVAGVRTDVSELVRTRQELERLSSTDALTGLANRRRFDAALAEEVARAQRHATPLALLLADVDHFKRFNDRYGHPEGDRALRAVAAVLARSARRPGELIARIGGEEFALLLPHADAATAAAVAARCREAMATLALPHGDSPTATHVTLSLGVALRHSHEGGAALLARADAALYAAKAGGRNCWVVSEEDSCR
jgi:diguanylate cyclase (GGDEF)-like protein